MAEDLEAEPLAQVLLCETAAELRLRLLRKDLSFVHAADLPSCVATILVGHYSAHPRKGLTGSSNLFRASTRPEAPDCGL